MWSHLKDKGIKLPKVSWEKINQDILPVLRKMEKTGIKLDVQKMDSIAKEVQGKAEKLEKEVYKNAKTEFNINSPSQMAEILFEKLKLPTKDLKKTKTGISTAASELQKLESGHKIIKYILEYRELSKLLSTYLKPLPLLVDKSSRLHTHYGQDTSTSRINSSEPNLQNIPIKGEWGEKIRSTFVAEEGMVLVAADYSQIELRVVACLAQDQSMLESFKKGEDIHTRTASEIFNISLNKVTSAQRRVAKTVNFGVLYGQSPYGLAQTLGIDQKVAAEYINQYFIKHPGIMNYCNRMIDLAHKEGKVETLFGFTRALPNINSPYRNMADSEERMAINAPVQGTAAEVLKLAMIELDKKLESKKGPRMLLTVHDELVVESPKAMAPEISKLVKDIMENVIQLCIPLKAEVGFGENWAEAKK